jgi:hypothetical protein
MIFNLPYIVKHDWFFDITQMENIPGEVKEPVEEHLFATYCSYIEQVNYADLLLNIMKLIRTRWNLTNSSMISSTASSSIMRDNSDQPHSNFHITSASQQDLLPSHQQQQSSSGAQRQPINIQFRRYLNLEN